MKKTLAAISLSTMIVAVLSFMFGYWVRNVSDSASRSWRESSLTIEGRASVEAPIDHVWIDLEVEATDPMNPSIAKVQTDIDVASIISVAGNFGVVPSNVDGSKVFVGRDRVWNRQTNIREDKDYKAVRTVRIRLQEVKELDEMLTDLSGITSVTITAVEFDTGDREPWYAKALENAMADARSQAEALTEAAGISVVRIVSIRNVSKAPPLAMSGGSSSVRFGKTERASSFTRETIGVTASVDVTFRISTPEGE